MRKSTRIPGQANRPKGRGLPWTVLAAKAARTRNGSKAHQEDGPATATI